MWSPAVWHHSVLAIDVRLRLKLWPVDIFCVFAFSTSFGSHRKASARVWISWRFLWNELKLCFQTRSGLPASPKLCSAVLQGKCSYLNAELLRRLASEAAACHRRNLTSVGQSTSLWCCAGFPLNTPLVLDGGEGQEVQGLGWEGGNQGKRVWGVFSLT